MSNRYTLGWGEFGEVQAVNDKLLNVLLFRA